MAPELRSGLIARDAHRRVVSTSLPSVVASRGRVLGCERSTISAALADTVSMAGGEEIDLIDDGAQDTSRVSARPAR